MTEGDTACVISLSSCRICLTQSRIIATNKHSQLLSTARARKGELATQHLRLSSTHCQHTGETLHIVRWTVIHAQDILNKSLKI